jgi:hypothetical protein
MKRLIKIVSISAKQWFKNLREKWPIYCKSIDKNFEITNLYLRHISWNTVKKRETKEIIERLSMINLIEKISKKWELVETREEVKIEKFIYKFSYKVSLKLNNFTFKIVLWEKINWWIVLISSFVNYNTK